VINETNEFVAVDLITRTDDPTRLAKVGGK